LNWQFNGHYQMENLRLYEIIKQNKKEETGMCSCVKRKSGGFILLVQSNAVGRGTPMKESVRRAGKENPFQSGWFFDGCSCAYQGIGVAKIW